MNLFPLRVVCAGFLALALIACLRPSAFAAGVSSDEFLKQAAAAYSRMDRVEAIALATKAVEADPKNVKAWSVRAQYYEQTRQDALAVADYGRAIQLQTNTAALYQHRGWLQFRLARFAESIADFDQFLRLQPAQAPYHWQRGIVCYYAGRFEDGRRQFELHQTVNDNDVENAVWHYLCVARSAGLEKARAALIPIGHDARVPMMQVHALFAGKAKPEDVLAAAKEGNPSVLQQQLFFAHLYLGLYYEAAGDTAKAREHLAKAAHDFKADHAMGDVARVHTALLRAKPDARP